jgi:hypothetical protein
MPIGTIAPSSRKGEAAGCSLRLRIKVFYWSRDLGCSLTGAASS